MEGPGACASLKACTYGNEHNSLRLGGRVTPTCASGEFGISRTASTPTLDGLLRDENWPRVRFPPQRHHRTIITQHLSSKKYVGN